MENKDRAALPPVVIVTNGRDRLPFLYATLGSLATALRMTQVHVIINDGEAPFRFDESEVLAILGEALAANGNELIEKHCPAEWGVGRVKAEYFEKLLDAGEEWVTGMDDDVLMGYGAAKELVRVWDYERRRSCPNARFFVFPVADVSNRRQYPDWTLEPKAGPWDFEVMAGDDFATAQFFRWEKHVPDGSNSYGRYPLGSRFTIARSIMHLPTMRKTGALAFWRDYPKGIRGHDGAVSRILKDEQAVLVYGATTYHIGLTTPHIDGKVWKSDPEFPELEPKPDPKLVEAYPPELRRSALRTLSPPSYFPNPAFDAFKKE